MRPVLEAVLQGFGAWKAPARAAASDSDLYTDREVYPNADQPLFIDARSLAQDGKAIVHPLASTSPVAG